LAASVCVWVTAPRRHLIVPRPLQHVPLCA
jgi:hypothetical protein